MSSLRQSSSSKRTIYIFSGVVLAAVALFALNYVTGGSVSRLARAPLKPFTSLENASQNRLDNVKLVIKRKKNLLSENRVLKERLEEFEILALNNLVLKTENEALREIARVRPAEEQSLHVVRVLSHTGSFPYGTLVIDNPGKIITKGEFVYGRGGVAIGTVLDSKGSTMTVHLLSAPGRKIDARVGESLNQIELEGQGKGNFTALIPRGVEVTVGEHVIVPEARGALVGVVGSVESQDTDAFQTVRVRVPLSIQTLQFVSL